MLIHLVTDILRLPDSPKGKNTLGSRDYTLKSWEEETPREISWGVGSSPADLSVDLLE
jgi:hypothetical protein